MDIPTGHAGQLCTICLNKWLRTGLYSNSYPSYHCAYMKIYSVY